MPKFLLFAILSFILFACQIEVAQPAVNKELRVASNFITKKQEGYFRAWQKKIGYQDQLSKAESATNSSAN